MASGALKLIAVDSGVLLPNVPLREVDVPERVRGCCVPLAQPLPDATVDELAAVYKALADPTRVWSKVFAAWSSFSATTARTFYA